jgi:hypothetical protein
MCTWQRLAGHRAPSRLQQRRRSSSSRGWHDSPPLHSGHIKLYRSVYLVWLGSNTLTVQPSQTCRAIRDGQGRAGRSPAPPAPWRPPYAMCQQGGSRAAWLATQDGQDRGWKDACNTNTADSSALAACTAAYNRTRTADASPCRETSQIQLSTLHSGQAYITQHHVTTTSSVSAALAAVIVEQAAASYNRS